MEASGWEVDRQNGMRDFWHQMVVPDLVNLEEKDVVKLQRFEILEIIVEIIVGSYWHFQTFHLLQFEKYSRHKHIAVYILSINIWRCLEDTWPRKSWMTSDSRLAKLPTIPRCGAYGLHMHPWELWI